MQNQTDLCGFAAWHLCNSGDGRRDSPFGSQQPRPKCPLETGGGRNLQRHVAL